jgi:hypothetical protein
MNFVKIVWQLVAAIMYLKTITPVGVMDADISLPITNTISNLNEFADYTFRFNVTTKLVKGGYVMVTFPLQFESGLGIPFLPTCTVTCSRRDRSVKFYFNEDLFPTLIYNMTIYGVQNPNTIGGTSQFIIQTYRGANLIDESRIYGILGFGGEIGTMTSTTVAVDSSSSTAAGEISKYIFSFRTDVFLPQNIYLKLQLPLNTFDVSLYPSCSSFPINGKLVAGTFTCQYNSLLQSIEVRGIGQSITANSDVGVLVSFKNPKYSFTTKTFDMYVMKEGTTMAFTRKLGINGVPITAGSISQIALTPMDSLYLPSKSKLMWYTLDFKLKNPLNTGAVISIQLPSSVTLSTLPAVEGVDVVYYVVKGLNDVSDSSPMTITKVVSGGSTYLRIAGFQSMDQPNLISVAMLIYTPASAGLSSPFQIVSYTDSSLTYEIDKDISQGRLSVLEYRKNSLSSFFACLLCRQFCHLRRRSQSLQSSLHLHPQQNSQRKWAIQDSSRSETQCLRSCK